MSSFNEEYLKLRKKRLEEQASRGATERKTQSNGSRPVMLNTLTPQASSDIAPVRQTPQEQQMASNDERKWFQKGAFEDGWQPFDLTKTIYGSIVDLKENVGAGILGMGEKIVDAGAYIVGGVGGLFSKDFKDDVGDFIAKDLYDEEEVAKKILSSPTQMLLGIDSEANSVFGEKSDALAQSGGQLLATAGLNAVGVPWYLTTGITTFGSEVENAFNKGATYGQAGLSAAITAGAEILTEKISGGISFGGKTLDDGLTNLIASNISKKTAQALLKFGVDAAGEGFEEVFSNAISAVGQKITYDKDKNISFGEMFLSEEAFENFIGGAVLGGGSNIIGGLKAKADGKDAVTGLAKDTEQKVVDKLFNEAVAEAEKDGEKLSAKEKTDLYNSVLNDLEKGRIDIDTIEEVLGEDVYKSYKDTIDYEDDILKQFEELGNKTNPTLADQSRYTELQSKIAEINQTSQRDALKNRLSEEVFGKVKDTKLAESYNEKARGQQRFEADLSQYDEKQQDHVKRALESGVLNNRNSAHEIVGLTAKIEADKGVRIHYVNNKMIKDMGIEFDGVDANGFVKDGEIYINVESPKYLQFIVGHEITHTMEQHKELYAEMQKALFAVAKSKGEYDSRLESVTKTYKKNDPTADPTKELTADLVGDYLFTDEDFVRRLSTEHRNVFQKVWDEIKHLWKMATAGSKEARELEKAMHLFEKVYRESGNTGGKTSEGTKYSLDMVDAVKPTTNKWTQSATTDEVRAAHPTLYAVDETATEERNPTQVKGTVGSYRKVYESLKNEGFTGTILDASSGLGYGTKAGIEEYGFDVEDIEPYPDSDYKPKYTDYSALNKKYDVVISNAVLNVLPQDQRDALTVKMGELLNPGGRMFVNVRGKDVLNASGKIAINESNMEYFIPRTAKTGSYQKGFTKSELVAYLEDALGDGYTVKPTNLFGAVSAIVTKDGAKYSISDSDGKQLSKGQQEYFKDSKMRDENGNLKVMYHGSQDAGFHVFDPAHSDDETSLFFVDRNDVAASYSGTYETYEAQTIRSAKDMNKFIESIGVEGYEVVEKDGKFTLLYEGDRVADSNTAQGIYEEFCWYEGVGEGDANYKVYLNLTNPLVVDAEGRNWNNITREYSQEVADRYNSLTAEEKAVLSNLAEWGEYSIFKDEMLDARAAAEQGVSSGYGDVAFTKTLARAYQKLGGANANLYDAFSIASDNFSAESIQEFAVKQMNTRDYAQKAKAEGYDGVIFNNLVDVGGYGNGSEGASTVAIAFSSNQIKSVANEQPGKNADIRFSLSESVEETKDLIAMHNVSEAKLKEALKLGGLPSPSVAITKKDIAHDNYGGITLLLQKDAIDPQADSRNKVYGSDAWTPTISNARTEYEVNSDKARAFEKKLAELGKKTAGGAFSRESLVRSLGVDDVSEQNAAQLAERLARYDEVRAAYLAEMGQTIEPEYKAKVYNKFGNKALQTFIDKVGVQHLATLAAESKLGNMDGIRAEEETVRKIIRDTYAEEHAYSLNRRPELKEKRIDAYMEKHVYALTIEDFVLDAWEFYQDGGAVTEEIDRLATSEKLRQAVNDSDVRAWLEPQIAEFLGEPGIYNGKDPFTADGRSRSFAETHYTYTAENIVKAMQNAPARGSGTFGAHATSLIATATPSYNSIEEMHADKGRLKVEEQEAYDAILSDIDNALNDVEHDIMRTTKHHADNTFDEEQIIGSIITEAATGTRTVSAVKRAFAKEGYTITTEQAQKILALYNKAANVPTGYFEAKPERVVGFNEIAAFIIPNNTDVKLKQELLNAGYNIAEYDPNVEGDRKRVVNQFEDYTFSLSDVNETPRRYGNYNIYGKDVRFEAPMQETVAPKTVPEAENNDIAPAVSETKNVEENNVSFETRVDDLRKQRGQIFEQAWVLDSKQDRSEAETLEMQRLYRRMNEITTEIQDLIDEAYPEAIYNKGEENGQIREHGWIRLYDGAMEALDVAVRKTNPILFAAKNEEIDNSTKKNPHTPIVNAFIAVQEDVRQDTITPMQGAQLLNEAYNHGGVDTLKTLYNPATGNLYPKYLEKAKQYKSVAPVEEFAPMPSEPTSYELRQEQERLLEEAKKVTDIETLEKIGARYNELEAQAEKLETEEAEAQSESLAHLDDADAPPEMEAPYYGETRDAAPIDPFEDRDMKEVSKNRKTPAYMYENPEVKPFFQEEAGYLLGEYQRTDRAETLYNGWIKQDMAYEFASEMPEVYRVPRRTSETMEYLLDTVKMSYADIEKGLNAIIEDNGAENIAAAKKLEFVLNDRLLYGYRDDHGFEIPANQDYINLLTEKQIAEYSEEARKQFFDVADAYAPQEDIAPVAETTEEISEVPVKEKYEAIKPERKKNTEPRLKRVKDADDVAPTESKTAEVYDTEPETGKKKSRGWARFRANFLDKQSVFEDLALKTNNRELMGKANYILSSERRAQRLIGKGKQDAGVKSLNDIRAEVESTGKTKQFYEYLYHRHNIDRMSLEDKAAPTIGALRSKFGRLTIKQVKAIAAKEITEKTTERTAATIREAKQYLNAIETKNKPVFGDSVTADVSRAAVAKYEAANPEFKEHAQDVYDYMSYLRGQMVESGVISQDTALLWSQMYPHYVPIRRLGDTGLNINVPLDTGRTGVNAPIKRATGGSRDILPLFDTMALRTEQTYKAIAKNNFGVELKNTLGSTIESADANLDEMIDSVDAHEELLKKGENGRNPTFTVFEDGKKVTFEITEDMYDALKPTSDDLRYTNKVANTIGNIHRGLLTEYNPTFMLTNAIKDAQDILINSQHPAKTYANLPNAIAQMAKNGTWYQEYLENGGESNTYFDGQSNTFTKDDTGIKKIIGMPLRAISALNNYVERAPRLAEYIASRKAGASAEVAMLDAARVTTNFVAGGDVTKFANRNGFTFLNASVQGAMQQVRNVREAKANGLKGWVQLATKVAIAGIPAMILNNLLWDDDEEYEQLSDYVKDNYYVVAKFGDGQFVRIPKGRAMAVIQDALEQVGNALTGDDEVDLANFLELAISNLAPNNPLDNNILAPIGQVMSNKTWYGDDLVPTRLQDLPAAEQFDESTDSFSKWLGEKLNISPYKLNYLLNQYSGGVGDVVLPMLTPEAESGDNSLAGNLIAPMKDKFTTDSVMNNQNVSDFYDAVDKLAANAKSSYATDEDILKYKYMNSVNAELSELYKKKREIQNSNIADKYKYEAVREVQKRIDELAEESLNTYGNVLIDDGYAVVGDRYYRLNDKGEWVKITDKQLDKQEEVTSGLGINPAAYWENKSEYDFAYEHPGKYGIAKSVGGYESYKTYTSDLYDIKADKDENGKSIVGSRKQKVANYINNLDIPYAEKIILFKSEYNADDTYNAEIVQYLNNRNDISYDEMVAILRELGFTVKGNTVTWD